MICDRFPSWLVIDHSADEKVFPMLQIMDIASNNFSDELSIEFFLSSSAMMVINAIESQPKYIGAG